MRTDSPFAIVPLWILEQGNARATVVYAAISAFADANLEAYPSRKKIGEKCGMDERTVTRAIADLTEMGAIKVLERRRSDGTKTSNIYFIIRDNPNREASNVATGDSKTVYWIPQNCPDNELEPKNYIQELEKPCVIERPARNKTVPLNAEGFEEFWKLFPRKDGRADALKAYSKALKKISHDDLLAALDLHKRVKWRETEQKYIPHASTWLNGERWLDDVEVMRVSVLPEGAV